jgi:hypothetical protein
MNVDVDYSKLNAKVARYVDELGIDSREVIATQSRLLLKALIKITPPGTNAEGRKAVFSDIARSMSPVYPENFTGPHAERIRELVQKKDEVGFQAFLQKQTNKWKNWTVKPFSPQLHHGAQNARGRVTKSQKVFVLDAKSWEKYVKHEQSHVGRQKAGWWPAYLALGGTLPSWITRHEGARGFLINGLDNKTFPTFTMVNQTKGIGGIRRLIQSAVRIRAEAVEKDIKYRLAQLAKKTNAS